MILADKIVSLRKKAGWSQEDLAENLGVTKPSVTYPASPYPNGRAHSPCPIWIRS